jgi:hypothetical protein
MMPTSLPDPGAVPPPSRRATRSSDAWRGPTRGASARRCARARATPAISAKLTTHGGQERRWREDRRRRRRELATVAGHDRIQPGNVAGLEQDSTFEVIEAGRERLQRLDVPATILDTDVPRAAA